MLTLHEFETELLSLLHTAAAKVAMPAAHNDPGHIIRCLILEDMKRNELAGRPKPHTLFLTKPLEILLNAHHVAETGEPMGDAVLGLKITRVSRFSMVA